MKIRALVVFVVGDVYIVTTRKYIYSRPGVDWRQREYSSTGYVGGRFCEQPTIKPKFPVPRYDANAGQVQVRKMQQEDMSEYICNGRTIYALEGDSHRCG